jgi:hypothetical protein
VYLIVLLAVIDIMSHHSKLLSLLLGLELLIELPSTLVVRTVMNEDTAITEVASTSFIVVLASFRVIIYSCGVSNESRGSDRA